MNILAMFNLAILLDEAYYDELSQAHDVLEEFYIF